MVSYSRCHRHCQEHTCQAFRAFPGRPWTQSGVGHKIDEHRGKKEEEKREKEEERGKREKEKERKEIEKEI